MPCSCQFVVSASGDYSVHAGDPDRLVEWDRIEQVVRVITMYEHHVCVYVCGYASNVDGGVNIHHICVDSSQTLLEHHRSITPFIFDLTAAKQH